MHLPGSPQRIINATPSAITSAPLTRLLQPQALSNLVQLRHAEGQHLLAQRGGRHRTAAVRSHALAAARRLAVRRAHPGALRRSGLYPAGSRPLFQGYNTS